MKIINGNLLNSDSLFIAHQTNCVGESAGGVAHAIFKKWPLSDDYARKTHGKFGTIKIHKVRPDKYVINMFSQYYPGGQNDYHNDTELKRQFAFRECLKQIVEQVSEIAQDNSTAIPTVSFPYLIGCGIAGGKWSHYLQMLENFEEKFKIECNGEANLYKLDV